MKIYIYLFTTLFIIYHSLDAQILNCPQNQIKFEKLIGIKPDNLQRNTLLYRSINNTPVTFDCLTRCGSDKQCSSFILYYNTSECYSYANSSNITNIYDYDSRPDTNVIWFRKTCLNVPNTCDRKGWTFEIQAGATLIGYNTRRINGNVSRERCIQNCIQETNFQCKSIKFTVISKLTGYMESDPLGKCTLSTTDRHLTPTGFRVSKYEDEYIENQCINTTYSSEYCAYEEYDNTTLEHTDLEFANFTQQECENVCDMSLAFNCRGYSIVPLPKQQINTPNTQRYNCLLHSEDSKLIGPKLLVGRQGAKYYERARCLNVSVTCSANKIMIKYQPEQPFTGRIYTNGYSDVKPCYADGRYNDTIILTIPMNDSICGFTQANSIGAYNRTLKSVLLVIQYNALIQTQADRLIKVGCLLGNSDDDTEVTLGTSVNFTNAYPNRGSTIVNSSSVLPTVTMQIVDYNTKQPVTDTELGEELQMIIEITPGNGPYDIWAGNLTATSDNSNDTLLLLDENGCPAYYNLISPFTNIQTNTSRLLVTNFQAFKFPSTPVLRFSVMVHFCTLTCPPRQCPNEESRLKRETPTFSKLQLSNDSVNATVYKIHRRKNKNDTDFDIDDEMPLEIMLLVKGVNLTPDQLVLGENRILVAGYDVLTNEVCVDYSLFIGLLIIWVILQVIIVVCCWLLIRKYKKYFHIAYTRQQDDMHQNFGFGDTNLNRRVRWADQ